MRLFLTNLAVNKDIQAKQNFADHHFHSILRFFDILQSFPFTKSETMGDYYLETCCIRVGSRVAERLKTYYVRKLGNIIKVSKLHRRIA